MAKNHCSHVLALRTFAWLRNVAAGNEVGASSKAEPHDLPDLVPCVPTIWTPGTN